MTYTYECDVVYDCPIEYIAQLCEATNATMRVIEASGPGGGNPFLAFDFTNEDNYLEFINLFESAQDQYITKKVLDSPLPLAYTVYVTLR